MGIYISNLKIPKDEYLPINIYPDGRVACRFDANCANAIEIPPHVDLVDKQRMADEVRKREKAAYDEVVALHKQKRSDATYEYYRGYSDGLITASGLVRFAPTIIPAEPPKEE